MKSFFYKLFKFVGDAFLTSLTEKLRKKDLEFFNPIHKYQVDQFEECYNHFKKYFPTSMLFNTHKDIREFSILEALENETKKNNSNLYLEFGVATGSTINFFSKYLSNRKIFGFDNFTGNVENWIGNKTRIKGAWNRGGKPPKVNDNVELIIGNIQNTLDNFLSKNDYGINFVHIDVNTYETTKFILEKIKPKLVKGSIIIFDDYYNLPGWRNGEHKAMTEVFSDDQFKYIAFHSGQIVTVRIL